MTTHTTLVLEYLRKQDDFVTIPQIVAATGSTPNQVRAALHSMRKARAVDVVIEPDGVGWWFATPEEDDQRLRIVEERTPEGTPRRKRKPKVDPKVIPTPEGWQKVPSTGAKE